jgi:hypothetical protein
VGALTKVFGIVGICPIVVEEDTSFEAIKEKVIEYVDKAYRKKNFTFKVNTRRNDKSFPMTSMEVNAELGHYLLEAFPDTSVDVHEPDEIINVEIRKTVYIYSITIPGPGGLPVGTNGKGMALLSGGIDSPVATYMIAKRGVQMEAVYFHAPPFTSERAKEKVIDLACLVADYAGAIKLHVVNFAGVFKTQPGNDRAAAPAEFDQSFDLELLQSFPQRDRADAHPRRELVLQQLLVFLKNPPINGLAQHVGDVVRGGLVSADTRHQLFQCHVSDFSLPESKISAWILYYSTLSEYKNPRPIFMLFYYI